MKKTSIIVIATLLALALVVPATMAALKDNQKQELDNLYQKMFELQKQVIQKQADFGIITRDQADWAIKQMEAAKEWRAKYGDNYGYGPGAYGYGHMGGPGMMGGWGGGPGAGWGHMGGWGGWNAPPASQN